MARRRVEEPLGLPVPPPELVGGAWVEDWLTVAELAEVVASGELFSAEYAAWLRQSVARQRWCAEHDVTPHPNREQVQVVIPRGAPRWRDRPGGRSWRLR